MIINRDGAEYLYGGTIYRIGGKIIGTNESEYAGLSGIIFEIRDGEDKETENETPDIYCSFEEPVLPSDIQALEETFTELYQEEKHLEDITLDYVIMAPEMVLPLDQQRKSVAVYMLTEEWAVECNQGRTTILCPTMPEAKAKLNALLAEEMENGCLSDWIGKSEYITETTENSYEGWLEGRHAEFHYSVSIEQQELTLSPDLIGDVGRTHTESCRFEDFASQVAEWDEVGKLTEQEYQRFLADKRVPDMIDKNLGDHYWESYWEAVSEAAHTLLREYLEKKESI